MTRRNIGGRVPGMMMTIAVGPGILRSRNGEGFRMATDETGITSALLTIGGLLAVGGLLLRRLTQAKHRPAAAPVPMKVPAVKSSLPAGYRPPRSGLAPHMEPIDVEATYRDGVRSVTQRRLTIHALEGRRATSEHGIAIDYVEAWCHLRQEGRTFMLRRFVSMADPATGEIIDDPHAFLMERAGLLPAMPFPASLEDFAAEVLIDEAVWITLATGRTKKPVTWEAYLERISVQDGQVIAVNLSLYALDDEEGAAPRQKRVRRSDDSLLALQTAPDAGAVADPWAWLLQRARYWRP